LPDFAASNETPAKRDVLQRTGADMIRRICLAALLLSLAAAASARDRGLPADAKLDALIARHAAANSVPEALVRRVILRESRGNARIVSRGNYGLMQIKLATARSMGYTGDAAGLLNADTNMTYAVKYLAGAYRTASGNHDLAVHYYAAGYYYAAKSKGLVDKRLDTTSALFASASLPKLRGPKAEPVSRKIAQARQSKESVSSSSNLYSGKLDYY
jgi:soluble lytic murein transglycosylase-like protein